jgi:hypothetical protein
MHAAHRTIRGITHDEIKSRLKEYKMIPEIISELDHSKRRRRDTQEKG